MAFMRCGRRHHDVNLMYHPPGQNAGQPQGSQGRSGAGADHVAFLVLNRAEFEAWVAHLRACGVRFTWGPLVHSSIHPEGDQQTVGENRALYFSDPSGNTIEICCDMAELTDEGTIDMQWHAEPLLHDGYDLEAARGEVGTQGRSGNSAEAIG